MILIISHEHDLHAIEVMRHLRDLDIDAHLLDLARFPEDCSLSIAYGEQGEARPLLRSGGEDPVDLTTVDAAWWRRPRPFAVPQLADSEAYAFTYNEWDAAIAGLWQLLSCFWINDPNRDLMAGRKAYQLREASAVGLRIPRTLISSDPEQASSFIKTLGVERTAYKVFSATEHTWRETRILRHSELDLIDRVSLAPVIFQEYIPADVDLRITIVGSRVFPAAIHSQDGHYKADFRMDMGTATIEPDVVPDEIEQRLLSLMDRLGLVYGAVDMRRTPEGEHVFLEVNTAGQWLFVEQETGQPIALAMAEALAERQASYDAR